MTKIIKIIVSPKGETKIETKGFAGSECQQASRFLEEALGKRKDEQVTPEFYVTRGVTEQAQREQQRG